MRGRKVLAIGLILCQLCVLTAVFAADAVTLAAQINGINGLSASVSGNVVTVTGTATVSAGLTLNIDPPVTVDWQASLNGTVSGTNYAVTLSGGGTLRVTGTISNLLNSGGALNITGTGASLIIDDGGSVASNIGGNAVSVNANDVSVLVKTGGSILSMSGSTSAAAQVTNGRTGVSVRADGGTIRSEQGGYALADGTAACLNNTVITVTGNGSIIAGTSTAIRSYGSQTTVTLTNGIISGAGTGALTPAVNMSGGEDCLILVEGGVIENCESNAASYAIQTNGNVRVTGGRVSAAAGRAINLTGMTSAVTVSGGIVEAVSGGTAICTATTNASSVAYTSVTVTGGTVSANSGYAIRITGPDSVVNITGGSVQSAGGTAIQADATAGDSRIFINGGSVQSLTGTAINQAGGPRTSVFISDTADGSGGAGGPGGLVSTLSARAAVVSNGNVTVNGGFVFAYGTDTSLAVNANPLIAPGAGGLIGVWNQAALITVYPDGSSTYLTPSIGTPHNLIWNHNPAIGSGITYRNGATSGFFPLDAVTVVNDYGLIFDASTGLMFMNVDGSGNPDSPANAASPFVILGSLWQGSPGILSLNGFYWSTRAPEALVIAKAAAQIFVTGANALTSAPDTGPSTGIAADYALTFVGGGSLTVSGLGEAGYGIHADAVTVSIYNDTFTARGTLSAAAAGSLFSSQPYYWEAASYTDGTGKQTGYAPPDSFSLNAADRYIQIKALGAVAFGATQTGGISGITDSAALTITFSGPVKDLSANHILLTDGTGSAVKGTLSGSGDTWSLALRSVSAEGTLTVYIAHFGAFFVAPQAQNNVMVYKGFTPAQIDDAVITGTAGLPLTIQYAVIRLFNETARGLNGADASSWFAPDNLPDGITVTADAVDGGDHILLCFGGTPLSASTEWIDITLPAYAIAGGRALPAQINENALFAITAAAATATISDTKITGIAGQPLKGTALITLNHTETSLAMTGRDVTAWFTGLPPGITVKAAADAGERTIILTFSGTPQAAFDGPFHITIPAGATGYGESVTVDHNPNAGFHIAGRPTTELPETGDRFPLAPLAALLTLTLLAMAYLLTRVKPIKRPPQ